MKLIYLFLVLTLCSKCTCKSQNSLLFTSEAYKNKTKVDLSEYTRDSLQLVRDLKAMLYKKEGPFYMDYATPDTQIVIDTIMYSPNKDKLACTVLAKYYRKEYLTEKQGKIVNIGPLIVFDGYAFLVKMNNSSFSFYQLVDSVINYENKDSAKKKIEEIYFHELATLKEQDYRYNFDDIRLWDEPIWDKF